MAKKIGKNTIRPERPVSIISAAAVGSKKEAEGPLAREFDVLCEDSYFGEKTWEKAESRIQKDALNKALDKARLSPPDIDFIFAGDLLNQCTATAYCLRDLNIPFIGLYGACSTMAEGLGLAAIFLDCGIATRTAAMTSSHFCTAERQFRFPLEYGGTRPSTSQWTVTGGGAAILGHADVPPYVRAISFGRVADLGINDINNMGAAMAPAAAQTVREFFEDTETCVDNYDLIITGDLGAIGSDLFRELMKRDGYTMGKRHSDCGLLIYDRETQQVESGASGAGCSAAVLCSYLFNRLRDGRLNDVLFVATGALMSTTTFQQGETIPSIAHLVHLSSRPECSPVQ